MTSIVRSRGSQQVVDQWREGERSSGEDDSEASSDDDEEKEETFDLHLDGSLRRRGHPRGHLTNQLTEGLECKDKGKQRRTGMKVFTRTFDTLEEISVRIPQRFCTMLMITSLVVWLWVDTTERQPARKKMLQSQAPHARNPGADLLILRKQREHEAQQALGSAAAKPAKMGDWQLPDKPGQDRVDIEALPTECIPSGWQTKSFPNCNEIHEIDLSEALGPALRRGRTNETLAYSEVGYVGSGLWRAVWKVHPHGPLMQADGSFAKPAVLKTMKTNHKVGRRNLDRHRRDALVMERLTSTPNIIGIYGFCGNTILSEFVGTGLDQIIYEDNEDYLANKTSASRESPLGRLQLALGVAKGVAALHSIAGGPIIHADLQAKQFLVDTDGTVKLNDFNRCRFVAKNNETNQPCPIRIPQAPGGARSPEEYEFKPLEEQIDMYSLGHVLFTILTGESAFRELRVGDIIAAVKEGKKPLIDPKYRKDGTSDADLAKLISRAYELDPKKRITATRLLQELGNLLRKYERSKL